MKKNLAITLLALIMTLALAACTISVGGGKSANSNNPANSGKPTGSGSTANNGSPADNGSANNNGGTDAAFIYGDGADYIAAHLGDYSITYNVTASGSEEQTSTVIRTSEGYYFNISGSEMLYIKNGDMYDMYAGSTESGFMKSDFGTLDKGSVEMMGAAFIGYMTQYAGFGSGMVPAGSETVAGRTCDKFTYENAAMGAAVKLIYSIDRETGVCLKYAYDAAAGGQSGSMTFECTEFLTSGVKLPDYTAE